MKTGKCYQPGAHFYGELVVEHYRHTTTGDSGPYSDQKEKHSHTYKASVSYCLESSISWVSKSFIKKQTYVQVLVQEYESDTVTLREGRCI